MRLRKECEHGRWEAHGSADDGYPHVALCPGGEFLPEGALVIEKVNGEWKLTNEGFAAAEDAYMTQTGKVSMRGLESALFAYFDALAGRGRQ